MKPITKYEAEDGTVFDTRDEALTHERRAAFEDSMFKSCHLHEGECKAAVTWMINRKADVAAFLGLVSPSGALPLPRPSPHQENPSTGVPGLRQVGHYGGTGE
jgi:hypothetical protein